jgi:isoleucyl-tRNA synthetase
MGPDKIAAYTTLYTVLITFVKLIAPFVPFIAEAIYQQLRSPSDPESVHLCRYPQVDDNCLEVALEEEMGLVRRIASLGHQARNQAQMRVRQPLYRALVEASFEAQAPCLYDEVLALVQVELNLESVEVVETLDPYFQEVPAPNFPSLGPRLGPFAQTAADWIKRQSAEDLHKRLASGNIEVEIDGKAVELTKEDIAFEAVLPEGFVLVEETGLRFLLDANLDDALREKGLVRELVHQLQLLRKEAGFEVTDRIAFNYATDPTLAKMFEKNKEVIASEILASEVNPTLARKYEIQEELTLAGTTVRVGLSRIAH